MPGTIKNASRLTAVFYALSLGLLAAAVFSQSRGWSLRGAPSPGNPVAPSASVLTEGSTEKIRDVERALSRGTLKLHPARYSKPVERP